MLAFVSREKDVYSFIFLPIRQETPRNEQILLKPFTLDRGEDNVTVVVVLFYGEERLQMKRNKLVKIVAQPRRFGDVGVCLRFQGVCEVHIVLTYIELIPTHAASIKKSWFSVLHELHIS